MYFMNNPFAVSDKSRGVSSRNKVIDSMYF